MAEDDLADAREPTSRRVIDDAVQFAEKPSPAADEVLCRSTCRRRSSRVGVISYREALQPGDARGDGARRERLHHGRGGRPLQRRLQGHRRACSSGSASARVIDAPIAEMGFAGVGHRRRDGRAPADHRVHDVQLLARRDRPDRQQRGEDLPDERRASSTCPIVFRGPGGPAVQVALAAQPVARALLRARPRASRS